MLIVGLFVGGCTTRTAGMQSPLGHDYDGMQWRTLDHLVSQSVIVAPAYTALVENDPSTDPDTLRARIATLPDDARESELVEVRVAVRPLDDLIVDSASLVTVQALDPDGSRGDGVVEARLASLEADGDWLIIDDLPQADAADTLVIQLTPSKAAAPNWEYAFTPGRVPYGGEPATVGGPEGDRLSGAIGFQTIFDQRTDVDEVAGDIVGAVGDGFWGDPLLGLIYAGLLAGIVVLVRVRPGLGRGRS